MSIVAAADGSALGNPGPAGWAWFVDDARWAAGGWPHGTNNQGELMAVIDLFEQTAGEDDDLLVLCDSQYVINAVTKWIPGWKRKGWRKADGSPVLNLELVQRLDAALAGRRYEFEWVKGHAGHDLNEAADERARAVATAYQAGGTIPSGPGWSGGRAAPAGTRVAPPPRDEDLVLELEQRLLDPAALRDPGELGALLHPDFEEIGTDGRLWDRATVIQSLESEDRDGSMRAPTVLRLGPDAMLVHYRLDAAVDASLRSTVWVRLDGRWRARLRQGTPSF